MTAEAIAIANLAKMAGKQFALINAVNIPEAAVANLIFETEAMVESPKGCHAEHERDGDHVLFYHVSDSMNLSTLKASFVQPKQIVS
jgi:hypothetical protein